MNLLRDDQAQGCRYGRTQKGYPMTTPRALRSSKTLRREVAKELNDIVMNGCTISITGKDAVLMQLLIEYDNEGYGDPSWSGLCIDHLAQSTHNTQ